MFTSSGSPGDFDAGGFDVLGREVTSGTVTSVDPGP